MLTIKQKVEIFRSRWSGDDDECLPKKIRYEDAEGAIRLKKPSMSENFSKEGESEISNSQSFTKKWCLPLALTFGLAGIGLVFLAGLWKRNMPVMVGAIFLGSGSFLISKILHSSDAAETKKPRVAMKIAGNLLTLSGAIIIMVVGACAWNFLTKLALSSFIFGVIIFIAFSARK